MTEPTVIPPQVRAARALLDWSQKHLAERAGVAVTTVRDMEEGKRADTAAAGEVLEALRNEGIEFVSGNENGGPGVRLATDRGPNLVRRPTVMTMWEGMPLDVEYRGKRFNAFVAREVLEDLGEILADAEPTDEDYLQIYGRHERTILQGVKTAFERGAAWSRDGRSLYVRPLDIRKLVPPDAWGKLIMADNMVMGGTPVFAGTRVPIKMVLELIDNGVDWEEHPTAQPTSPRIPDSLRLKSRRVVKQRTKA
jgi:transcriptional regulator with XRE-family HTH domain